MLIGLETLATKDPLVVLSLFTDVGSLFTDVGSLFVADKSRICSGVHDWCLLSACIRHSACQTCTTHVDYATCTPKMWCERLPCNIHIW